LQLKSWLQIYQYGPTLLVVGSHHGLVILYGSVAFTKAWVEHLGPSKYLGPCVMKCGHSCMQVCLVTYLIVVVDSYGHLQLQISLLFIGKITSKSEIKIEHFENEMILEVLNCPSERKIIVKIAKFLCLVLSV